jgi:WD40 repeat protein
MSSLGPKCYDAFLSFNSQDRLTVREIAERLRLEGLQLYLEEWELAPGREFQPALAKGLSDSKTCVVFLGPNGLGPWQKQELQIAVDRRARDQAFHVIPVLLPGSERPRRGDVAHLDFLINASWVEFLTTLDDERAFRGLVWGITGTKPPETGATRDEGFCPYRGLETFRPDDAKFFFGRESLTGWLVSALRREVRSAQGVRFLGVLGPSGGGKSSVVLAGLVPNLRAGAIEGSERWPVAILRPGDDPLKNLAVGVVSPLLPAGSPPDVAQVLKLVDDLRADARTFDVFAQVALHDRPEEVRMVVVVDQFEEVFTYRPQGGPARVRFERDRDRFFANLLNAAATPGGRVAVVLTMRSDFLSACAPFPQLSAVLSAHQELVGPMTAAELREAIERPAYLVGCEVESALAQRLIADVEGQSGALPLLQFALYDIWKRKKRDDRRLTLRAYAEPGKHDKTKERGIKGLLNERADEIYAGLTPEDKDLCRRLFLRLVQPGEGTEDTKRRVSYSELLPDDPGRAEAVRKLVQTLTSRDARLITTEGTGADGAVEVAHEALVRGWTQLRNWLDAERSGLRIHRRLTEDSREWTNAGPESQEDFLYSGGRLAILREWAATHRDELNSIEAAFLAASEELERRREQDELEKERRLREGAEAAARRQKRLSDRFLRAAVAAVVLAATSLAFMLLAYKERRDANFAATAATKSENKAIEARKRAEDQSRIAESRRVAALSELERGKRLDRALLLAVEAVRIEETTEARDALFRTFVARPGISSFLHTFEGHVRSVAFSRDGRTLAVGYGGRDPEAGGGDWHGGVVLWDAKSGVRLRAEPLDFKEGDVTSVAFSPDGKTLATGIDYRLIDRGQRPYGGVTLWDVVSGERLRDLPIHSDMGPVTSVAFRPDGKTLAASHSGGVTLWDEEQGTWRPAKPLLTEEGNVTSVAFSPDGKTLAAGYGNAYANRGVGGVALWDAKPGRWQPAERPLVVQGSVSSVAFRPDGKALAAGYGGSGTDRGVSGVVLWDAREGAAWQQPDAPLLVTEGSVTSVAFRPDGKALAAAYRGGGTNSGVALWDAKPGKWQSAEPLPVAEGSVQSVAFRPDGKALAAGYAMALYPAGYGSGVVLWDEPRGSLLQAGSLPESAGHVWSLNFSPDGKTLAAFYGGGVTLWDAQQGTWKLTGPLPVAEVQVDSVAFRPDGKALAAGYSGRGGDGVALWDVQRGEWQPTGPLPLAEGSVGQLYFSPNGETLAAVFSGRGGDGVALWDARQAKWQPAGPLHVADVRSIAFNPDGKTLAIGYGDGAGGDPYRSVSDNDSGVALWDVQRGKWQSTKPLPLAEGSLRRLTYSPDGKTLAAAYTAYTFNAMSDSRVMTVCGAVLWDAKSGVRLLQTGPLSVAKYQVQIVDLSPDGKTLAAVYNGPFVGVERLLLWDAQRGTRFLQAGLLPVAGAGILGIAFSPDGKILAVSYGRSVVLWDAQRGTLLQTEPLMAKSSVTRLTYSPDGKALAASYSYFTGPAGGRSLNSVLIWEMDLEKWKQLAGQVANRNLTLDEWRRSFPDATYRPTFLDLPAPSFDEHYKDIARNLSQASWHRYFPDKPYRKTFDDLPVPPDAETDDAPVSADGVGVVPKKIQE